MMTNKLKASLLRELKEEEAGCAKENWDGYQALPVPSKLFRLAENFIRAIPDRTLNMLHTAEVNPLPYGELGINFQYTDSWQDGYLMLWIDEGEGYKGMYIYEGGKFQQLVKMCNLDEVVEELEAYAERKQYE